MALSDLLVNGLRCADLGATPLLADSLVLQWRPSSLVSSASFEVLLSPQTSGQWSAPLWSARVDMAMVRVPSALALSPDTTYEWRVRANSTGAAWSAACAFDIAPAWEDPAWIGGASQLRTDWTLPAGRTVARARAYATGLGAFELHLNGAKVGDHVMDPGQSVYDEKVLYVGFDVTHLLVPASENAIGALVGNGKWGYLDMYANRTRAADQSGDGTRAFAMLLTVELDDGARLNLTSGPDWVVRHGPIVYDHLWHGEIYDARHELSQPAWDAAPLAAYPQGTWASARRMAPLVGSLFPQQMPPIRVQRTLQPVRPPMRLPDGSLAFDFGTNLAGFTTLSFEPSVVVAGSRGRGGAAVVMLRLTHAEILDAAGTPDNIYFPGMEKTLPGGQSATCSMADWYDKKWYECANQSTAYVLALPAATSPPGRAVRYTPTFTYHGFRFVRLRASVLLPNGTEAPLPSVLARAFPWGATVEAHVAHTDLPRITTLDFGAAAQSLVGGSSSGGGCSPPTPEQQTLTAVFNATLNSHVSQLWSIPTDCPQREKRGWMGDAGLSSSSLATFYASLPFHVNFLRLIADNQRKGCTDQPKTDLYGPCTAPPGKGPAAAWFNGSVPDVVPFSTGPYGGNPGSTDWQAAYPMVARAILRHSGGAALAALAELFPSLERLMAYFDRLADPASGLLLTGARGDWIPPKSQAVSTHSDIVAAFTHTLSVSHMADIAAALNETDAAKRYSARLRRNRAAFDAHFFNGGGGDTNSVEYHAAAQEGAPPCCYGTGSQASNVFALHIGAVPDARLNATLAALVASFGDATTSSPLHLDLGIFGTTFVFDVLRRHDLDDLGLRILNETSYPSLGRMVAEGATTLWESWEGDRHHPVSSRNHIMFGGGVNRFLAAAVGGLATLAHRDGDGWGHVHVKVAHWAVRWLGAAVAERAGAAGPLRVAWRGSHEEALALNVSVPFGSSATVDLPLRSGEEGVAVGACALSCVHQMAACSGYRVAGCRDVPYSPGDSFLRVSVGPGTHAFVVVR